MTGAQLARDLGVSTAAITQGTRRGLIVRGPDGLYDLDDATNRGYVEKHGGRPAVARDRPKRSERERQPPAVPGANGDAGQPPVRVTRRGKRDEPDESGDTYHDLARRKLRAQAAKAEIDNEHKRGILIERELVDRFLKRLARIDTTEWRTLADRVGARLAGAARAAADDDSATMAVREILAEEVYRTLQHAQSMTDAFVAAGAPDEWEPNGDA